VKTTFQFFKTFFQYVKALSSIWNIFPICKTSFQYAKHLSNMWKHLSSMSKHFSSICSMWRYLLCTEISAV
jgi:hypothetical protein